MIHLLRLFAGVVAVVVLVAVVVVLRMGGF
jgi:hypothetical protein